MDNRVNELSDKLFKAIDPNNPYSYDEFIHEYGNGYQESNDSPTFLINVS